MAPWLAAPIAFAVLVLLLLCHRGVFALFPEDLPGKVARKLHTEPTPLVGWTLSWHAPGVFVGGERGRS